MLPLSKLKVSLLHICMKIPYTQTILYFVLGLAIYDMIFVIAMVASRSMPHLSPGIESAHRD